MLRADAYQFYKLPNFLQYMLLHKIKAMLETNLKQVSVVIKYSLLLVSIDYLGRHLGRVGGIRLKYCGQKYNRKR